MDRYLRSIKLIIGDKEFTYPDFTIYFRVNFDEDEDANDARIEIYNLSTDSTNRIKKDSPVILSAGHDEDLGTIFTGVVDDVSIDRQQADKIATIEANDRNLWRKVKVSKTWQEGTTAEDIINDILGKTGLEIAVLDLPENKVYNRGKTIDSTAYNAIKKLSKDCKAKFHYNMDRVYIRDRNEGDETGVIIDKETGLVDMPEKLEENIEDEDIVGWNVTSLLNHNITTDTIIKVNSKTANGKFRVKRGQHLCDRDRFYTKVEAVEL